MNKELLSTLIKNKRKENKLTQQELADKIGVSLMSVVRWENGSRVPSMLLMPQIAAALNTTVGYLMGIEDSPDPVQAPEPVKQTGDITPITGEDKSDANNLVYEWGGGHKLRLPNTPETRKLFQEIVMRSMSGVAPATA